VESTTADAGAREEEPKVEAMNVQSQASQSSQPAASEYFPLSQGASWRYGVKVFNSDGEVVREATVEKCVEGVKTIGGKDYLRLTTKTLSGTNLRAPDQHYRHTGDGIFAAVEGVQGKELMVFPGDPHSQRSWTAAAPPVIKRVTAKVDLPAETTCGEQVYRRCVHVDLDMVMRGGGFFGPSEVPVRIERWFAPGVGMVRERRTADGQVIDAQLTSHGL
jgi:hypothetical protein